MDSTWHAYRRIVSTLAAALVSIGIAGCYSGPRTSETAPRSSVTRDLALTLAKDVASSIGGRVYAIAPSGSMIPTLDEGSIVTVERVSLEKLKMGDIVIYRNAKGLAVIHRLYECHDGRWYVLGDNNTTIDRETVSSANFLGRVCAIFYTSAETPSGTRAENESAFTAIANTP